MSRRYAVVGDPVGHSLSPLLHRQFSRMTQRDTLYCAYTVRGEEFADFVRAFFAAGGSGLNVTVPHKERAAAVAEQKSNLVRRLGAANVLMQRDGKIAAYNTDGGGLIADLIGNLKISPARKRVLLLGGGGAAAAAAHAVAAQLPSEMCIVNRTEAKAQKLAAAVVRDFPQVAAAAMTLANCDRAFDIVINATSAGLSGDAPSVPAAAFSQAEIAYDIAYGEAAMPFLNAAKNAARTADGMGMLVEQAALSFALWENVRPTTSRIFFI